MRTLLLTLLLLTPAAQSIARDCNPATPPVLDDAWFTDQVRAGVPHERLLYLPAGSREIFVHATTRGAGKVTYRWFRNGKRVIDVGATVGAGTWHTWSRLRLPPPVPDDVSVQLLGADGCLLREITLAGSAFADQPEIRKAWQELAAGDATGAGITLKILLETAPAGSPLARAAQRMLDRDVAIGRALQYVREEELFLVESSLREVEKRLRNNAADRAARERIADVRRAAAQARARLDGEAGLVALATRHLLETEKLVTGDYPLWREDAEKLIDPALRYAGDQYRVSDWKPTLRGYVLVLQDKRTGNPVEVTSD